MGKYVKTMNKNEVSLAQKNNGKTMRCSKRENRRRQRRDMPFGYTSAL